MMNCSPKAAAFCFAALFLLTKCVAHEPKLKDTEGPPSLSSTIKEAPTVPFCDLIRDPGRYEKQIVRTQAIFLRNMENAYLYDPACGGENTYVWAQFDPSFIYTEDAEKTKFDKLLCPTQPCPVGKVKVIAIGRFEGPSGGPYGHLDAYRFRFSLMRLKQVEAVEARISESK